MVFPTTVKEATDLISLAREIIRLISDPQIKSRTRRYSYLKDLFNVISKIHSNYMQMFITFENQLVSAQSKYEASLLNEEELSQEVKEVKFHLSKIREEMRVDRGVWKDKVQGMFIAANDSFERRVLYIAYWYLEYRDDFQNNLVDDINFIEHKIGFTLEDGGSATFDSPSASFTNSIRDVKNTPDLIDLSERMRLHLSEIFQSLVRYFHELEEEWRIEFSAPSVKK